jgi:hypothetical protein
MSVSCLVFIGDEHQPIECLFVTPPRVGESTTVPSRDYVYQIMKVHHVPRRHDDAIEPQIQITVTRREADR